MSFATREKLARRLLGHDVFVSYSRADGASYAAHLASELTKRNLSCRLDQWGSKPGKEVPAEILRDLRRSSMLVVVGSRGATKSAAVEREVLEFLPTGRLIIPIDVDGSIRSALWWPSLEGLAVAREAGPHSGPSQETIDRIANSVDFTRRNARLTRYSIVALAVFAVLTVLALVAGQRAAKETRRAAEKTQQAADAEVLRGQAEGRQRKAEEQAQKAEQETQRQQELAAAARQEREVAEAQLATTVRDLRKQEALAESRRYQQTLPIVDRYLGEGRLDLACRMLDQMPLEPRNWEWDYYRAHCERGLFTLSNRDERVAIPGRPMHLAFSADGTLALWNSETGQLVRRLGFLPSCSTFFLSSLPILPEESYVKKVSASPDGTRRAEGKGSGSILLFEKDKEKPFLTIQAHQEPIAEIHFSPDGKLLVSRCGFDLLPPDKSVPDDRTARVWEIPTGRAVATLEDGSYPVEFTLFSPDSRRVLTASGDNMARLWDARTGGLVARLTGHTSDIGEAAFSQDGSLVLTASGWKCSTKIWANQADPGISAVTMPADHNDESHFDIDHVEFPGKSVEIEKSLLQLLDYDLPKPYIFKEFKGHTKDIAHARFLRNGKTLLTVSLDHTARVWDIASGTFRVIPVGGYQNTGFPDGHSRDLFAAVLLDNDKRLLTAAQDGFLKVWDVRSGRCLLTIDWIGRERRKPEEKGRYQTEVFRLSRDRRFIAIRPLWDASEPIKIWDLTTGKLVNVLRAPGRELETANFSPDSSRLVTVTRSIMEQGYETPLFWTALVWDVQQGEVVATLRMDGSKYVGGRGKVSAVSHLVEGSVKLDKDMAAELKEALSSGRFDDADFDAEGQSVFAILSGGRERDYRIWTWNGLPPRLRKLAPADFNREIRAWKLERLLGYLGESHRPASSPAGAGSGLNPPPNP